MNRVAVYLRVSTEEQALEGFSIEGQLRSAEEYCVKKQLSITSIYKDEGISATDIEGRNDVKRLLEDCKHDSFDSVLVWKFNRLARSQ